jgi:bacterioferritin
MTKAEIISLLNQDIESEHGAIIQYLSHAYAMGEGEISCEIEAIAREEMRHLDWLAEKVTDFGGTISLTRGKMIMKGTAVPAWMKNNVLLEEDAMETYKAQIKKIVDPEIKRLLKRILSDEEAHHGKFDHFIEKTKRGKMIDKRGKKSNDVTAILDWGIEHEYTVVLQYLLHSYLAKDEKVKEEMQDQVINEMQHLGWLAEEMIDRKGSPKVVHTAIDKSKKLADMLKADIAIEKKVAVRYDKAANKVKDEGLKKLLIRIRDHERYHADIFTDLLKKEVK